PPGVRADVPARAGREELEPGPASRRTLDERRRSVKIIDPRRGRGLLWDAPPAIFQARAGDSSKHALPALPARQRRLVAVLHLVRRAPGRVVPLVRRRADRGRPLLRPVPSARRRQTGGPPTLRLARGLHPPAS